MSIDVTIRIFQGEDGELSDLEKSLLAALAGEVPAHSHEDVRPGGTVVHDHEPAEEKPKPRRKPGPKPKAEPTQAAVLEDDPDEPAEDDDDDDDLVGGDDEEAEITLQDAVALAQELVGQGSKAKVSAALSKTGADRVKSLKGDDIVSFYNDLKKIQKKGK